MKRKLALVFLLLVSAIAFSQSKFNPKPKNKTTTSVAANSEILVPYRIKELWGFSDTLGVLKVNPIYKDIKKAYYFRLKNKIYSYYLVRNSSSYFVIDAAQKALLPENNPYDSIALNTNHPGYFLIYKNGKTGIFYHNKEAVPCLYDKIKITDNDSYKVYQNGRVGILNRDGKLIVPIEYTYVEESTDANDANSLSFVWKASTKLMDQRFTDKRVIHLPGEEEEDLILSEKIIGEIQETPKELKQKLQDSGYEEITFAPSLKIAYVTKGSKKGIIGYDTEPFSEIITAKYDEAVYAGTDHSKKVFLVNNGAKFGFIKEGNSVFLPVEYDDIEDNYIMNGHITTKNGLKGLVTFNTIYPFIAPKYNAFKDRVAISISDKWNFNIFRVKTQKSEGYVGENGVEFFKD